MEKPEEKAEGYVQNKRKDVLFRTQPETRKGVTVGEGKGTRADVFFYRRKRKTRLSES